MHNSEFRIRFPSEAALAPAIHRQVARHLTHTEMGLVLPVLSHALDELLHIDCELRVPGGSRLSQSDADHAPILYVAGGAQADLANAVLGRQAVAVQERDPYALLTLKRTRAWFGLAREPAPSKGLLARAIRAIFG